jgi:cytochrome c1
MVRRSFYWALILTLGGTIVFAFAHEKTGWIAPESAKKMKNPIKPTKTSIQKGKEFYEKKCTLCHGMKGDGKGSASAGSNPEPTNFRESHGEKITDGEHFWKITTGREHVPSYEKEFDRRKEMACDQLY